MDDFYRKILELYLYKQNRTEYEKKRAYNRRDYIAKRMGWRTMKDIADT